MIKIHYFGDGNIRTEQLAGGSFAATDADSFDPLLPVGEGATRWDAIVNFMDKMRERGLADIEPFDHQAAAFDHTRDARKHEVLR